MTTSFSKFYPCLAHKRVSQVEMATSFSKSLNFTEGIVMGGGFLIHRFFNHFLVKEHEKPAEDQKKQDTIF